GGALADRPPEPIAELVAVAARLVVAEPPVIRGDVSGTPLQEDAFDARNRTLDGLAQRRDVLGVPLDRHAADRNRMRGEADDGGERPRVGALDAEHAQRVVDGARVIDAVTRHALDAADGRAEARRLEPPPRGVGR